MAYFNIERGKLPTTHPYYKANSTALVNPLCLTITTGAQYSYANYFDPDVDTAKLKRYLANPMTDFLPDSDNFLQGSVGVLYVGYALGLENALTTYSIGAGTSTTTTGTFTVQKDSDYGYNVLANGSVVGGMSKIAPIIFFELTGGGGGGSGSYKNTMYGSGGGGGGACIRGLIDLSRVSNIYYQVGIGGEAGSEGTSGGGGDASWISVVGNNDRLYASGGGSGKVYASGAGGTGGFGGTCYRSYNGSNVTPGGLTSGSYQTGLYVLKASSGGAGGNGARGDGKPATAGKGASIGAYIMVAKTVISASSKSDTSLVTPTGTNLSSYSGYIAGGGGSSAVGQGGRPSIAYATYNGQYTGQNRAGGSFPGGGGGGACCFSSSTDYYTGGAGANGRLYIAFASMRAPS